VGKEKDSIKIVFIQRDMNYLLHFEFEYLFMASKAQARIGEGKGFEKVPARD